MTDEELQAANLFLERMIPNDPRVLGDGLFKAWLREERDKYNDDRFSNLILDTTDATYNRIHGFLLTDGYMGRVRAGYEEKYLTEKGIKAKQLGGVSKYLKWQSGQKILNKAKEISFWIILATSIISAGYAIICYHFNGKPKSESPSKSDTTTLQLKLTQSPKAKNATIGDSLKYKDSLAKTKNDSTKTRRAKQSE